MNTDVNVRPVHRDRGTALLLTIAFVVMIGTIAAGLAGLVTSGLNNTVTLQGLRDRQYAAEGAIEKAIAVVNDRIDKTENRAVCGAYEGEPHDRFQVNEVSIWVDWSGACGVVKGEGGLIFLQRDVVFTACLDDDKPCTLGTRIIRAQVNFDQGNNGPNRKTVIQSWSVDS